MSLSPRRAVRAALARHWTALGYLHGYLDMAVTKSFEAYSETCAPEEIRGGPFASTLRQTVWSLADNPVMARSSMRLVERPNMGMRLVGDDVQIKILKRPFGRRPPQTLPVAPPPVDTLFGLDWPACPFELAVLWAANVKGRCLHTAVLAAVAETKKRWRTAIYAEEALPTATAGSVSQPPVLDDLDDDFDDEHWAGEPGVRDEDAGGEDDPGQT